VQAVRTSSTRETFERERKKTHPFLLDHAERVVVPGDPNGNGVSSRRGSNLRTQLSRRREGGLVQTVLVVGRVAGTFPGVGVQAGTGTGVLRDLQMFPRVAMAKTSSDVQTCEERSMFKRFERLLTGRSNTTKTRSHPYRPPSPPSS
jgi:hypothetical protein